MNKFLIYLIILIVLMVSNNCKEKPEPKEIKPLQTVDMFVKPNASINLYAKAEESSKILSKIPKNYRLTIIKTDTLNTKWYFVVFRELLDRDKFKINRGYVLRKDLIPVEKIDMKNIIKSHSPTFYSIANDESGIISSILELKKNHQYTQSIGHCEGSYDITGYFIIPKNDLHLIHTNSNDYYQFIKKHPPKESSSQQGLTSEKRKLLENLYESSSEEISENKTFSFSITKDGTLNGAKYFGCFGSGHLKLYFYQ